MSVTCIILILRYNQPKLKMIQVLLYPDALSMVGSMNAFEIYNDSKTDVVFALRYHGAEQNIVQHTYTPNDEHRITVDVKDIILPLLAFELKDDSTPYIQENIMKAFSAEIYEVGDAGNKKEFSFSVIRAGVDKLADSAENFLKNNFLTWQPQVKAVTYYSPEFLTYYAAEACAVKCKAYLWNGTGYTESEITLAHLTEGCVYTIPVQYAIIAKALNQKTQSYYDVWVEKEGGDRLTYVQRYYASDMKSEEEEWFLFENSLGGVDCFRAYGNSENTAEHTHNVAEIEDDSEEYRVDTTRKFKKNTGYLDGKERLWLLDFFPSLGKYVYHRNSWRKITVTESDVNYEAKELPSNYTFTYKYSDARPYLNLSRASGESLKQMDIHLPDIGNFTIAPRLVEFPRQQLGGGVLFPVQDPHSEEWGTTTADAIFSAFLSAISNRYSGKGEVGHKHINISVLDALSFVGGYLLYKGEKLKAGVADVAKELDGEAAILKKYIRRDIDDTAEGTITFEKVQKLLSGLLVGNFNNENGGSWTPDAEGRSHLITDYLEVRMKAIFEELVIKKTSTIGGKEIISPAGGVVAHKVEEVTVTYNNVSQKAYRCYFLAEQDGDEVDNDFAVNDQVRSESFNVRKGTYHKVGNHFYWRLVIGRDEEPVELEGKKYHYIDLSDTDCATASDVPAKGDVLSQCGNRTDIERQNCLIFSAVDTYSPSIGLYHGINSYSFANREYVEYGVNKQTNKAFFNVYGDMYVGDRPTKENNYEGSSYIKYDSATKQVSVKGKISAKSTVDGKELSQYIKENSAKGLTEEQVNNLIKNSQVIADLQNQVDGAIETWFYEGEPTLTNAPASSWTTDKDKDTHLGDLYYDNKTGKAYRFAKDGNTYKWTIITDTDIAKALSDASKAQETADGKMKVFSTQPTTPYQVGDIWVNATYPSDGSTYKNEILRCQTAKAKGSSFAIADWTKASKYTDDSALNTFKEEYKNDMASYKKQLDEKVETWFYNYAPTTQNKPASDWTTDTLKSQHAGDLFYNTSNGYTYRWTGTAWGRIKDNDINTAMTAASKAQDTADGKRTVFTSQPTVPYDEGDLWASGGDDGKTLMVCIKSRTTGSFTSSEWVKANDSDLNAFAKTIEESLTGIQDQLDKKAETWYQSTDPSTSWTTDDAKKKHKGDLWYNTSNNQTFFWNGTKWDKQDVPTEVFDKIDGKSSIYVSKPASYEERDLWILEAAYTLGGVEYSKGELVVATKTNSSFSAADWAKKVKYTDDTVANAAKKAAEDAQKAAQTAQTNVTNLGKTVTSNKKAFDSYVTDGYLEPSEIAAMAQDSKRLEDAFAAAEKSYNEVKGAEVLKSTKYLTDLNIAFATLTTAKTELVTYLSDISARYNAANTEGKATIVSAVGTKFTNFQSAYRAFYDKLGLANAYITSKIYGDLKQNITDLAGYKYIKDALGQTTDIDGGLVMTTLLALRDADGNVQSGINGAIDPNRGKKSIATWWGGRMVDKDYNSGSLTPATSLVRFDGSGYLANGAIWWDVDGKVHADPTSFIISEKNLGAYLTFFEPMWKSGSAGTSVADLVSLKPNAPFSKLGVSGDATFEGAITFHGIKLTYDATNKAIKVDGNLYATGGITAYGEGSGSSSGGGLNGSVKSYADALKLASESLSEIASAYSIKALDTRISSLEGGSATAISVSGSGNAVTSITKNGTTISVVKGSTFLTSHQSLAGYATQSWVQNTATAHSATKALALTDYNDASCSIYCGWAGAELSINEIEGIVGLKHTNKNIYYKDVNKSTLQSWLGLGARAYDNTSYLPLSGGTLTGNLNGTGAIFGGRIYGSGDDEGILIKTASDGWAGLILGSTDSDRSCFYFSSNNALWKYVKDGTSANILHPHKDGTIALISDIPTKVSSLSNDSGYITSSDSITGNAATATKLQTARSLWGNSFNGTADINGSIIVPSGKYISIGNIKMEYDATNKALKITNTTTDEVANLYTSGGVSAYGVGTSSSSSGGLNGSVKSYADALKLASESLSEIASAYSIKALDSRIVSLEGGSAMDVSVSGSGNAVTAISKNGTTISVVKGSTFLTSHQSLSAYLKSADAANTYSKLGHIHSYAGSASAGGDATRTLKIKDYNGSYDIYCGFGGDGLLSSEITHMVGIKYVNNTVYYKDVSKGELQKWLGLGARAYDNTSYLPLSGGTLTGNLNGTGAIFGGRIYGSGDDEGILIKTASDGWAGLILGSTDSDRSCFYFSSNNALWKYVKDGTSANILHPHKDGTIALISDIPTKVSSLSNDSGYITSSGSCAYSTNAGNADKVDGVHVTWQGSLTSTSHLVAWEDDGSALRDLNPVHLKLSQFTDDILSGKYLPLGGGAMSANARISASGSNLYIGNTDNSGFIYLQDMSSQVSSNNWQIRTTGAAKFKDIYIAASDASFTEDTNVIEDFTSTLCLNWYSKTNINLCNGGGNVNIGMNGAGRLNVAGNILATGGITAYSSSDIRLKQDLRKLDYLGIIKAMGGTFGFAWKKDNTRSIGFIAQHVLSNPYMRDIVETDEKGYYKINYWSPKLIATAFGAIEQVGNEVSRLKARVVFLESEVQRLSGKQDSSDKKRLDNKNINLLN